MIKITAENIDLLKSGDIVLKYPTSGEPVEDVDINDKERMSIKEVGEVNDQTVDLLFCVPENTTLEGMKLVMGPLHKNKKGMIEDNIWWIISN